MVPTFQTLVCLSVCWFVASSLSLYPHSLSYFNESIGGPSNGPKHLLGSNVDWGQDLRYLQWSFNKNEERRTTPLYLAYYGYFDPGATGFEDARPVRIASLPGQSTVSRSPGLSPGQYAVSVNLLFGQDFEARDGESIRYSLDRKALEILRNGAIPTRIGGSIALFDVD